MTKTKRDLTLHLIDDKTVVIADKAIMLEFLKENREPEFRTRLIQPKARTKPQPGSGGEGEYDDGSGEYSTPMDPGSAAPGRPGAATLGGAGVSGVAIDGGGGGPTPATPGGGGVSGTPGAAPDQDGEAGGRGSSIAGTTRPNWRTLDPRLKTMLDTLDRGREDSDRVFTFVIDTRDALKQIQAMAQFIPNAPQIPRVRAVGTTLYSLNSRKLIAKAMIEMGSGREARDVTQEIQVKLSDPRAWDGAQSMLVSLANFLNHPISYRDKSPFLSGGSGSGQPGYPGMGGEGYGEDYSGMGGRGQRGSDGTTIIRPSLAPAGGQPGGEGYPGGEGDYGPGGMQPGFPGGRPGFPSGGPGYPGGEEGYPGGGSGQGSGPPKSSLAIYADDVNIFLEVELDWQRIFREEIAPPLRSAIATQKGRMIVRAGGVTWTELATTADPLGKRDEGFPTASYPRRSSEFNLDVPPTKRVSWMRELLPMLGHEGIHRRLDPSRAWDAPSNSTAVEAWIPQFLNPKFPDETWQARPAGLDHSVGATHFVGMAGVGMDAAYYAPGDPRNGIFGHDPARRVKMSDISDGAANTIYMIQVPPVYERPWAHGGATVAGVPKQNSIQPFVSDEYDGKKGTYALMADGTVRFITEEISDEVFKGISTIAGNEGAPILLNDVAPKVKPGEVKQEQVSTGPTDR